MIDTLEAITGAGSESAGDVTNPKTNQDSTESLNPHTGSDNGGSPAADNQVVEVSNQHPQGDAPVKDVEPSELVANVEIGQQPIRKGKKERSAKQQGKITLAAIDRVTGEESADLMLRRAASWQGTVDIIDEAIAELKAQLEGAHGIYVKKICSDGVHLQDIRDEIQKTLDELESGGLALTAEEQAFFDS